MIVSDARSLCWEPFGLADFPFQEIVFILYKQNLKPQKKESFGPPCFLYPGERPDLAKQFIEVTSENTNTPGTAIVI